MAIPRKTITFENGETRDDVPVFINTFEDYERFKNSFNGLDDRVKTSVPEAKEADEYGGFGRDVKRVYRSMVGQPADLLESVAPLNALLNPFKTAEDLYGEDFYELGVGDRMERVREARAEYTDKSAIGSLVNPTTEELDEIIDQDGYATRTETTGGDILNVGSYIVGGLGILGGLRRLATTSPRAFRDFSRKHNILSDFGSGVVSGVAVDQWITNPNEENMTSMVLDAFEVPDSALLGLGEYLRSEEDDSDLEKRTKMLLGNLPLELVAGGIIGITSGALAARRGKSIDKLTPEEIAEEGIKALKRTRVSLATDKTTLSSGQVVDDAAEQAQVFNQEGTIKGIWQKFSQSRGFKTYSSQDAFEQSQQAGRKYRNKAQHISSRLQHSINNILKNTDDEDLAFRIQDALTSEKVTILAADKTRSEEALVKYLKTEFNLTDEIAEGVIDSRRLIDELSLELKKYAPTKKVRETIDENLNVYLRRSYKKFEDENFVPTENVIAKAQQYFLKTFQEDDAFRVEEARRRGRTASPRTLDALEQRAIKAVDDIMGAGDIETLKTTGSVKKIFKERKNIAEPVRELLGEITDPEDLLILTVDKMSKFYERARFLDDMNNLGTKQNWLFNTIPQGGTGKFVKLTNTGSKKLDGKFTTPNMEKVIMNKEISLFGISNDIANPIYKNLLSLKGFANKAATVFNWTTHVRNFLGGVQFGLANGINPFSLGIVSDSNAFTNLRVLANEGSAKGNKAFNELHEKYLELGIINTNVKVGDFRALINEGAKASDVDNLMAGLSNKVSRGAEKLYVATDDFFKINAYNTELNWLKKAYGKSGRSTKSLELEAADIVKNTMPNYDRVPPGIKALRNLPLGTFVSFPAEILRTSYNIFKQSAKEITSGNSVLAMRGGLRGAGMVGTAIGFEQVGEMGAAKLGWSDDERKAATVLAEAPWSGPENVRLWRRDEETGKIFVADTKYLDSYNTVKEPLMAAYQEIQNSRMEDEDIVKTGFDMIVAGIKPLAAPFVSEAIFTKTVTDMYSAINNPDGRTPDGRVLFSPNDDPLDKVGDAVYHILDSLAPGTLDSASRLIQAYDEERNPYTGETKYDAGMEWNALLTGVRWTEWNPEQQLHFKISEYKEDMENLEGAFANYEEGFGTLSDAYRNRQRKRYGIQRELYRTIQASQYFRSDSEVNNQLEERGISSSDANELLRGRFIPEEIDHDDLKDISTKVGDAPERYREIRNEFRRIYSDMNRTLLNTPTEED